MGEVDRVGLWCGSLSHKGMPPRIVAVLPIRMGLFWDDAVAIVLCEVSFLLRYLRIKKEYEVLS